MLYLAFVAWVGIVTAHPHATYAAIAAMGVTYLSYIVQIMFPPVSVLSTNDGKWSAKYTPISLFAARWANTLVVISIALGIGAGILLLV